MKGTGTKNNIVVMMGDSDNPSATERVARIRDHIRNISGHLLSSKRSPNLRQMKDGKDLLEE